MIQDKSETYEVNEKLVKKDGNLLDDVASFLSPFDKSKKWMSKSLQLIWL